MAEYREARPGYEFAHAYVELPRVQGVRFQALAAEAILIWLRTTPDYFLLETLVR